MRTYIIRRLLQMIVVLLIVTMIVFFLLRLLPGDPIYMYLSQQDVEEITPEQITFIKQQLGLDQPLVVQYVKWMGDVFTGDLGNSLITKTAVMKDIQVRLPVTLHLGILAFVLSIIIGLPMGVVAAARRGSWIDNFFTAFGNMGITLPSFWLGILLIYLIGYKLEWLPIYGYTSPFKNLWLNTQQIILPVIVLAAAPIATGVRITRSSMLEVLQQDYIRTAWSKGLQERHIILKHALRNGLLPVVAMKGMSLAAIIGGSVLVETVFSIPGMGRLAVEGLFAQDYPVVQATLLIVASFTLLMNILIDLSYGWLDPRVRYE
ncbi:MAG TPA: ABC transporter permease [Candidatus Limnocylindrales bacterium]|nr:ABC transporter permease [Candidatus Limnocylindrales bacterium]